MAEKHLEDISNILGHLEIVKKNYFESTSYSLRMIKTNKINDRANIGEDIGKGEHLFFADRSANLYTQYGNQCSSFSGSWDWIYLKIQP